MRKLFFCAVAALALSFAAVAQPASYEPAPENLAAREKFAQDRFGIFIHWGIYSMLGQGEWVLQHAGLLHDEYRNIADGFCPSKFNADEWVETLKASGAKYITITSRHHDGFSMFDTQASDYKITNTPFGRDVIKELSEACAKGGMTLNFYYSHLDWGRTDYWPLGNTGRKTGRPEGDADSWAHYKAFMDQQLTELLTNYGPIGCIWFDGQWDKKSDTREEQESIWGLCHQYDLIHSIQPACLVGNNHHLDIFPGEDIQIFEKDVPGKNDTGFSEGVSVSTVIPLETCQTMNDSWGYNIKDRNYKSVDYLIKYLAQTAGKGANLLLNVGPRPDGTLPEEAVSRLRAMGEWLGKYGESIYGTDGGCIGEQEWGVTTQKGNVLYMHVLNCQDEIEIPLTDKLQSAVLLETGAPVTFTQKKKSTIKITMPEATGNPDMVVKLTFKNAL